VKTTKSVINSTLSAILRDAIAIDRLITENPAHGLEWPRQPPTLIDPFDSQERDELLEYFRANLPRWYPFAYFQFWTGTRPGEATALKWGAYDLESGRIWIGFSRHLGHEAATKTSHSTRTLTKIPNVIDMLRELKPLHASYDEYVFTNTEGRPMDQNEFRKRYWTRALRATGIRPRPFYNTRHTYISTGLSAGRNPKWMCEQVGTSMAMLEKHYGKYIPDLDDGSLDRFLGKEKGRFSRTMSRTRKGGKGK